jgi:hypothetical protein
MAMFGTPGEATGKLNADFNRKALNLDIVNC